MAGYPAHGPARVAAAARTLTRLPGELKRMMHAHCDVAALHAKHLGLPADVIALFPSIYERWDGKGGPARVQGDAVPRAVRIAQVARDLDIQRNLLPAAEAANIIRSRAGHAFDPDVVAVAVDLDPIPTTDSA
jgi:HD-GYP domain-containing protein (c-di-GMP phosphodiesterase class II)